MAIPFTNLTNLALDGFLAFGNQLDGHHSGLAVVKIPVTATEAANTTATEKDTGFDLKAGWTVLDAWIVVNTADTGETVDVGTNSKDSGDADGLIDGASLATTGLVYPDAVVTAGATETYYSATTRGALLADYIVGSNMATDFGLFHKKPYTVAADIDLTFTTSNGTDTAAFDIYLLIYDPSPTAAVDVYSKETMAAAS
ncbi:MAG TPA: hypothetical protein PKY45_14610 [Deltaproteobacteria bacterium]|nr:hypothetical protein [Deltaproteobacteria bacterium]